MTATPLHASHSFEFDRAQRRGRLRALAALLRGAPRHLSSLEQAVAGRPTVASARTSAPRAIALDAVAGTVSAARARDFGADFTPLREHDRQRWMRVLEAVEWRGLPPIRVFAFEGRTYVEDGHHRVSVMRALGLRQVEAYVSELRADGAQLADAGSDRRPAARVRAGRPAPW